MLHNSDITLVIKERLSILSIISSRIKVIQKGSSYVALCPFHSEKTPSFHISETKGLFHCFGCGESGDIFKFIMLYNKVIFKEALEYLASLAGVSLEKSSKYYNDTVNTKKVSFYKTYYKVLDLAATWFSEQLFLPENKPALQYLFERGFSEYTIKTFKIGYAPKSQDKLLSTLQGHGFDREQIIKAGLRNTYNNTEYDVFKNRIIFPIKNKTGNSIAFGGRSLNDEVPKYLNSKDSELFHKKLNLYGLSEVIKNFKNLNYIILVEGYLDVLALYQNNLPSVAPLGTAISVEQLNILVNLKVPLYICLDGDSAGKSAALKAANMLLDILNVHTLPKFIILPDSEDPASYLQKYTKLEFMNLIKEAVPLSEFLWQEASCDIDFSIPESKALLQKKLNSYILKIKNINLRNIYKDYFSSKLHNSFSNLFLKKQISNKSIPPYNFYKKYNNKSKVQFTLSSNKWVLKAPIKNNYLMREYYLLSYIIYCPQIYNSIEKEFALLSFSNKELDELKQALVLLLEKNALDSEKIKSSLDKDGFSTILNKIMNLTNIKKTMSTLKTPEDFINAFYNTYNSIISNSLTNEILSVKEGILKDKNNVEQGVTKNITKLRYLEDELNNTIGFKGKYND